MMNISPITKRITAALLAAAMAFSMAACGGKDKDNSSTPGSSSSRSSSGITNAEKQPQKAVEPDKAVAEKITEKKGINADVVGWLTIPGTEVDEEVFQGPGPDDGYDVRKEGEFYERRNINKEYDWYGVYFADYEGSFGDDRNDLSDVTIIYGHSMDDDPDGEKFSKLKRYNEQSFAEEHPYFYFTTPKDNMTWQVFSVAYTDLSLSYNHPNASRNDREILIKNLQDRSLYDYDVDVTPDDKLLILSTCTYKFGNTLKEQEGYRYLISARLVGSDEKTSDKAKITVNEDATQPTVK